MKYDTFSDLVNDLGGNLFDFDGATNGNITGENGEKFAQFYSYWSNYLEPTPAFLAFLAHVPGGIAKALYQITASLEHVFNNMFKLFGLFGYLGDNNTVIGKFFYWSQVIGTSLFTLILVVSAITGVFTKPVKYKGVITNFLLVTLVTSVMPLALTTFATSVAQDAMNIQTISSESSDDSKHYSSLAIQPMKNNVVDLKVLIDNDFSTELFPLDNYGYIKPPKEGSTPVNNITDSIDQRDTTNFATRIDFAATYGTTNTAFLQDLEDKQAGLKGLFLHKLNTDQNGVETIEEHRIINGLGAFEPVYLRYKVNWVGMFMQYIILIVLLISMSIKLVKSVFDIIIEAMISPIQGYSSLSSSKKYKELLRTMGGAIAGIFFEVVIMRVVLEVCRDLPTLSVSAITKLSGGFFDGLNMWEQCLAASLVYIGIFMAAMQGVTMIERWLGVSTGHSDTAQQLLGAMMMGNAFATGARGVGNLAMGAGQFGMDIASKVPGAVASGSKVLGNSLAVTGGGIRGTFNSLRDQGLANTAKGGVSNMVDLADMMGREAVGKVKDFAGGISDKIGQKEQAAHDAVYKGLQNDAAVPRPWFNDDGQYSLNASGQAGGVPLFPDDSQASDVMDSGPSGGGITDPTLPQEELSGVPFSGVSDPTVSIGEEVAPPLSADGARANLPNLEQQQNQRAENVPVRGGKAGRTSIPNTSQESPQKPEQASMIGSQGRNTSLPNTSKEALRQPEQASRSRQSFQQSMSQMNYMNQQMQQAGQRMQGQSHIRGAEIEEGEE